MISAVLHASLMPFLLQLNHWIDLIGGHCMIIWHVMGWRIKLYIFHMLTKSEMNSRRYVKIWHKMLTEELQKNLSIFNFRCQASLFPWLKFMNTNMFTNIFPCCTIYENYVSQIWEFLGCEMSSLVIWLAVPIKSDHQSPGQNIQRSNLIKSQIIQGHPWLEKVISHLNVFNTSSNIEWIERI